MRKIKTLLLFLLTLPILILLGAETIAVPSMKGMTNSFKDFGVGALGGAIYGLARLILGSGFIGALGAPIIAGSAIPGPRGVALSTVAGYMALQGLFGTPSKTRAAGNEEVT